MLRITSYRTDTTATLKVEGRIAGEWVGELSKAATTAEETSRVVLDLGGVTYVDADGASLLRALRNRGFALAECSAFVSSLIDGGSR